MRNILVIGLVLVGAAGCTVVHTGDPGRAHPRGHAHGHARRPSGVPLVVIKGTGIEYVNRAGMDVFLYGGVWFKFEGGLWHRANAFAGPYVRIASPPAAFGKIPPGHAKGHVVRRRKPAHVKPSAHGPVKKPKKKR